MKLSNKVYYYSNMNEYCRISYKINAFIDNLANK